VEFAASSMVEPEGRWARWIRLPMRVLSLRTIVIIGQLAVITLVVILGVWVWIGVTNDQYSQLDRRLDSVSSLGDINTLLNSAQQTDPDRPAPDGNLARTARIGGVTVSVPTASSCPNSQMATRTPPSTECNTGSVRSAPARLRLRSRHHWLKRNIGSTNCTCGSC